MSVDRAVELRVTAEFVNRCEGWVTIARAVVPWVTMDHENPGCGTRVSVDRALELRVTVSLENVFPGARAHTDDGAVAIVVVTANSPFLPPSSMGTLVKAQRPKAAGFSVDLTAQRPSAAEFSTDSDVATVRAVTPPHAPHFSWLQLNSVISDRCRVLELLLHDDDWY